MSFTKETIDLSGLNNTQIKKTLSDLNIALTPEEGKKIQDEMLGRPPSIAELVLFSIQGSEHCSYKSSRNHLKQFVTDGPDVILGAKEDAGVVSIVKDNNGKRWCIVMSHESHNHPSQIVPYDDLIGEEMIEPKIKKPSLFRTSVMKLVNGWRRVMDVRYNPLRYVPDPSLQTYFMLVLFTLWSVFFGFLAANYLGFFNYNTVASIVIHVAIL